ncbi:hypothetical protein NN561_015971 [Cricetulus griseus]
MEPKLVSRRRGGGEGSGPPPGVPRSCAPRSPERGGGCSHFWQPRFHRPSGGYGVHRLQHWCGAPLGAKKSPLAPLLFQMPRARSRPGKARSPQCAKQCPTSLNVAAQLPVQPGSSAHSDCPGAPAPRLPFGATRYRGPHNGTRRSAPSAVRRRGARARSLTPTRL